MASRTSSSSTPGCRATSSSSPSSGDGRRMPRSVMTAEPGAAVGSVELAADRGDEVHLAHEGALRVAQQNDHAAGRARDLRRAAGAGQAHLGRVVVADHRGVDVAEAVDLRGAEEADVDPPAADPVVEHLRHRDQVLRAGGEVVVADRQRQALRARPDGAGLVDEHAAGRVQAPGEVGGGVGRPDPDQHDLAVDQLARGADRHDLLGRRVGGAHRATTGAPTGASAARTFSSIHCVKRSRSREIASQSE